MVIQFSNLLSFSIRFCRLTSTYQVTVSIGIVYTCYAWPEFVVFHPWQRESCLLAGVFMVPLISGNESLRVRCIFKCIVCFVCAAFFNVTDFLAYSEHGITETVQLCFIFTFCWLYHQRARNREAHSRGMETIINEALGNILSFY